MTRKLALAAAALALLGALTACAPNAATTPEATTPAAPSPTPTVQAQVETPVDGSVSFDEIEAMFEANQNPVFLVPNNGTFWVTDLPTDCTLTPDFQYWGSSSGEVREAGGIAYDYEGDILAISATDTAVGWSTSARFTCGPYAELRIEVTA